MQQTTVRFRPDQVKFIAQLTKKKATDLSDFVRQCVDQSASAVAKQLPKRRILSMPELRDERRRAKAPGRRRLVIRINARGRKRSNGGNGRTR